MNNQPGNGNQQPNNFANFNAQAAANPVPILQVPNQPAGFVAAGAGGGAGQGQILQAMPVNPANLGPNININAIPFAIPVNPANLQPPMPIQHQQALGNWHPGMLPQGQLPQLGPQPAGGVALNFGAAGQGAGQMPAVWNALGLANVPAQQAQPAQPAQQAQNMQMNNDPQPLPPQQNNNNNAQSNNNNYIMDGAGRRRFVAHSAKKNLRRRRRTNRKKRKSRSSKRKSTRRH